MWSSKTTLSKVHVILWLGAPLTTLPSLVVIRIVAVEMFLVVERQDSSLVRALATLILQFVIKAWNFQNFIIMSQKAIF